MTSSRDAVVARRPSVVVVLADIVVAVVVVVVGDVDKCCDDVTLYDAMNFRQQT